ncbi:hypothetical protein BT96DRAFT_311603 [Gymnopus androsaceus JB14]|uniref:TLC domain-containing protein n=1 Tax=Gymnopus androsaceus JB14 TaxID=1447944 RepID=A0A6A4H0V8_9AGAR|nr:hypothetical protein BT96DRAFT_311603 [Gymnopus androsaceus JB14]
MSLLPGYDSDSVIIPSQESQWSVFVLSFVGLVSTYHVFAGPSGFTATKQVAWILTTISSFIMTVGSLPFVWDYVYGQGDVKSVRPFPELAVSTSRFFQAYLLADLCVGSIYYRSQITFLTGWFHHIVYLGIVEYAIRQGWAHVFALAAFMEFPTLILGTATLFPRIRSNIFFAVSFFLTRILFHIIIGVAYYLPKNRPLTRAALSALSSSTTAAPIGSVAPAVLLTFVFPMHAGWFLGCLKGFKKRAKLRREAEIKARGAKNEPKTTKSSVPPAKLSPPDAVPHASLRRRLHAHYIYDHYAHYYSTRYAHYSSRYAHYRSRLRGFALRSASSASVKESLQQRLPSLRPTLQRLPSLETFSSLPALSSLPSPIYEMSAFAFDVPPIAKKVTAAFPTREKLYGTLGLGKSGPPVAACGVQVH